MAQSNNRTNTEIAEQSFKDAMSMRIVALVTLFYLPGAYISVCLVRKSSQAQLTGSAIDVFQHALLDKPFPIIQLRLRILCSHGASHIHYDGSLGPLAEARRAIGHGPPPI